MSKSKKEKTVEIQMSLGNRSRFPISYFDSRNYIQHNLMLGDGLGPLLEFMDALPADRTKVNVRRAFEDGDYSVAHAEYELGEWGRMVGFEVHRWENERIVEHWDNLQPMPAGLSPSGHSMTDGVSEATNIDSTQENKATIERFTADVLIGKDTQSYALYFYSDQLIQHSPWCGDGSAAYMASFIKDGTEVGAREYKKMHMLLGEGNMVLAISEGTHCDENGLIRRAAFYDLYRLEDGVIREHWDVVETIPPRKEWRNENGKF